MITVLLLSPSLDITYLVPSVTEGAIHRPREVVRVPGGKGLNLARAATRLGGVARVVAPLGGQTGTHVARLAAEAGVAMVPVAVEGETRSCITVAADDDGRLTEFYEPSAPLSAHSVAELTAAVSSLGQSMPGWTVLSGSVPAGVDPEALVHLLRVRAETGDRIAVDTHGPALAAIVEQAPPTLLKVNRLEAGELLGRPDDSAFDLATALRERTGGTVVVTDGAAGSVAVDGTGSWRALPLESTGPYSVGSGDSFLAGMLVALEAGAALPDALADATAAGAANATVPGAAEFSLERWGDIRGLVHVVAQ